MWSGREWKRGVVELNGTGSDRRNRVAELSGREWRRIVNVWSGREWRRGVKKESWRE